MQVPCTGSLSYPFNQFAANPRSTRAVEYADESLRLSKLVGRRIDQFDRIRKTIDAKVNSLCDRGEISEAEWVSHRYRRAHSKAFNRIIKMQNAMLDTVRKVGDR